MAVFLAPVGNGQVFLTAAGLPANGGFINTYLAGTTTPASTFTTSAGTIANANPIVLTPAGLAPFEIWLTAGTAYKFVVTDALLNPIGPPYDNLVGIGDGNFLSYTPPGTGAVTTTVSGKLGQLRTPQDFGAKGDGINDDAPAFSLMSTALGTLVSGFVPPGTYKLSTNESISCTLSLQAGAILKPNAGVTFTLTSPFVAADRQKIFDLSLGGTIVVATSQPYVTPQHFGALANFISGSGNDDTTAITNAVAAAKASGTSLHFPNSTGSYHYNSASPILVNLSLKGILADGDAVIDGTSGTSDCFEFQPANYGGTLLQLPSVANFTSGKAIKMDGGANLATIKIPFAQNCLWGVSIETNGTNNSCLDNTIYFTTIATNTNASGGAIQILAFNSSSGIQGNAFYGNFINDCTTAILFTNPPASTPNWNTTYFEIMAIEGASLAGSRGVYCPNGGMNNAIDLVCPTFFGGFASDYINLGTSSNNNSLKVNFDTIASYSKISINGIGNYITPIGSNKTGSRSAAIATTANNQRSTFNSGNPVVSKDMELSFVIPNAQAVGTVDDFYAYSPYTDGFSDKFWLQLHDAASAAAGGMVVVTVEDASVIAGVDGNTVANQIHIRLMVVGAATVGRTITGTLHTQVA